MTNLGSEPKGNVYGTNSLINFGPFSKFSGTTSQRFGTPSGPYGGLQAGNSREPIRSQTNETFNTGNLTAPYASSEGGFITPEEFNANFAFESQAMSVGWTYDATSPITNAYTACNVGNNPRLNLLRDRAIQPGKHPDRPGAAAGGGQVHALYFDEGCDHRLQYRDDERVFKLRRLLAKLQHSNHQCVALDAAQVFTAQIDLTPAAGTGARWG